VLLPSGERVRFTYDAFARRVRKEVVPAERADFAGMVRLALEKGAETLPKSRVVEFLWDGDVLAADIDLRAAEEAQAKAAEEPASAPGRRSWKPRTPIEELGWTPGMRVFVHEPGTFVPMLQAEQGAVFTYVNDHLGMPKELIDQDGRVAWAAIHSAWGRVAEVWRDPKAKLRVESPFRLLGQYTDEETKLCYTRFRYFDAGVGRWCSPDPRRVFGGTNLFGWNGNIVGESDPLGLSTDPTAGTPYLTTK
jgi:RHS repeat-associated protein